MDSYQAIKFIYQSYVKAQPHIDPNLMDIYKRHPGYCRQLLLDLGLDLTDPPSVLVTGSKGKGSTSVLIAGLMQAMGARTGLFTGPHLVDFCERIRLNGRKIPEEDLIRLIEAVRPKVEAICNGMPPAHYMGPVGTIMAVALLWYKEEGTDFHVIECGRGALADDANVLRNRWSVLTPVMLEHPDSLGPTLLDIAANKMAVIKSGQELCVSYRQVPEVVRLLRAFCRRMGVPLKLMGTDFDVQVVSTGLEGSVFKYTSKYRESTFRVPLPGRFQAFNAGAAIALAEEIRHAEDAVLQTGLDSVRWPGRCELVPGEPLIILDGAINAESAAFLKELLEQTARPIELIVGVPADKDWQGVIRTLAPMAKTVWLTTASNPHLVFPPDEAVLAEAAKYNADCRLAPDMAAALELAAEAAKAQGVVVIAGTQSLIRDAKIEMQSLLGRESDG